MNINNDDFPTIFQFPPIPTNLKVQIISDDTQKIRFATYCHTLKLLLNTNNSWLKARDVEGGDSGNIIIPKEDILKNLRTMHQQGLLEKLGDTSNTAYRLVPEYREATQTLIEKGEK